MIKKIRSSLFAKVFIITMALLLFISLLVFAVLAWVMPKTYSQELNSELDMQVKEFVFELEQSSFADSGNLFDRFIYTNSIASIELYSYEGELLETPTSQFENDIEQGNTAQSVLPDAAPILSSAYYFSFSDTAEKYTLIVYGEAAQILELQKSFIQVFPLILVMVIVIGLFTSWLFSHVITFPVLKICKIATKMSDLQLDWELEEQRTDELGTLKKSLNILSRNLQTALSDLKKANAKLEADIEHEKELEQAQMDFFSAASHELKTPITIIKGQLEGMLLKIGVYKDREKYLARSLNVANTLEDMVYELLTISRLQTSNSDFKIETFDCISLIRGYLSEIEDLIATKNLQLNQNFSTPVIIKGNKILIKKVFSNLIGNAVKYSPQGAIIDISIFKQKDGYLFSIENSGTHIPKEAIPKIFEAFYRVDMSRSRQTGGSGLGLYIVQKILQQHDSCCNVCNTENGVKFFFELL